MFFGLFEILLDCLKMLLEFGDIVEILFMVDLCFPFPKNSRFVTLGEKQKIFMV